MNTIDINLDINRVEGFGKPIEDEGIRLAVLARCLHIPGSENIVIALTNSIVRRVKSVPPENTKMMPALLWATKWFFALMDEYAEDRRMYTALAQRCSQAYSASRAKYSTVAVDVSVQMVQLPFWNTLKAAQNMAAVLRECMSSTTDNCTQEDRYFSNLARLDGRLAETGVYREGVWAYIRPMIGRMAEHIVQDVFLHRPPQNVPWLHLDPQNLPGTLLRQFLLADWKSREIRECGFQSICCAYVKLISNSETLRQMYWQEPLRVEEGDPLLENPPDRETLLAFMTLRLLSRSCADPEVLHRAMLVQYGEDALQETWQQAVRYACRMGGLWMSWQIRQGPVLEGLTQEQMRAYERYVYILVCAKNAEGLREAVRFAVQYHVQGIAEALVHYRSIPGYEDFASVQLAGLESMPGKPLLAGFTEGLHVGTE